jgi:hypothetical protein
MSEDKYFNTRAFMIRYQEEEVELNDICHFRIEMPLEVKCRELVGQKQADCFMEVELMFSDLQTLGGPDKFQQITSLKELSDIKLEFKPVAMKKY